MTVTAESPVIPSSRPIAIPPIRQATAQGMLRLAEQMRKANPEMLAHQHLEDAADQVRIGNDEGALRHLKAAAWGLQPQSLHRHGIHDDKGHVAARQALEGVLRHHHLVRDIQDAEARNQATIAREAMEDAYGSPPLPHDPNAGYGPGALAARPTPRQPGGDQAMNAPARNNSGGADRAAADPDGPQPRGSKQFARSWDEVAAAVELAAASWDWDDLAKVVEMAAQPAITGKMDVRTPATAATARGHGRPDESRPTWLSVSSRTPTMPTGITGSRRSEAQQGITLASTAADRPHTGQPSTGGTERVRTTSSRSASHAITTMTDAAEDALRQRAASVTDSSNSPMSRSLTSGTAGPKDQPLWPGSSECPSRQSARSSTAGTGGMSRERLSLGAEPGEAARVSRNVVALSARTPMLEVTPAPYGRPGGPGLYRLRGNSHSPYFESVVQALMSKRGMSKERASAVAWGALRRWSTGRNTTRKGHVTPVVQAAAGRALGQEATAAAAAKAAHAHSVTWDDIAGAIELAAVRGGDGTTWEDVASVVELAVVNVKTYQRTVNTPKGPMVQTITQHPQNYRQGMGQPATAGRTQAAPMTQSAPARQNPAQRAAQKQRLLGYAAYDRRQAALLSVQLSAFNAALYNALYGPNTTQAQKGATTAAQAGATTAATAGTVASPQSAATAAGATPAQVAQTQAQAAAAAKTMSVPQLQAVVKSLQAQIAWYGNQAAQYTAQAAKL